MPRDQFVLSAASMGDDEGADHLHTSSSDTAPLSPSLRPSSPASSSAPHKPKPKLAESLQRLFFNLQTSTSPFVCFLSFQ